MVVAVNGQVGTTSALFRRQDGEPANSFAAVVPDVLYRTGPGPPQLYLTTGVGSGGRQLRPVTIQAGT
jgi:hypothetical protein